MAKTKVTVPIDASAIESIEKGHQLKVVAVDAKGARQAQSVRLDGKKASATFTFDEAPGDLRIYVGPADAEDDHLDKLQNAAVAKVAASALTKAEVTIDPIVITLPQWEWWLRWCRIFVVHGKIVCPDGTPVPGAQVCAYDVDWFLWWRSTQLVTCAMTDANGEFTMKFRWCCGWWPWWWWRLREWELDLEVLDRITRALPPELKARPIPLPDPEPDMRFIEPLLGRTAGPAAAAQRLGAKIDFKRLETTRTALANRLPRIPELDQLRLWPWWPWAPWFDCNPDLIFRATQDCQQKGTVIVNENVFQTRWNIPTTLNVTLVANQNACCAPQTVPGENCMALDQVCDVLTANIGGNVGAPASPVGFASPGVLDRPFAGGINVYGTNETLTNAEYYTVERAPYGTNTWTEVPITQLATMGRAYLDFTTSPFSWHFPAFAPAAIDGHAVYESRHHYETTHPGGTWGSGSGRIWVGFSAEQVFAWLTSSQTLADGTYKLRIHGYNLKAGHLVSVDVPVCGGKEPSEVVVTVDNRLEPVDPLHATYPPHPCGAGTIHACITEPDTDFLSVTILHGDKSTDVQACNQYDLQDSDTVEIRFYAYDPNSHLYSYAIRAYYGDNDYFDIVPGYTPVSDSLAGVIPSATSVGSGGVYIPVPSADWNGGVMKVDVPGSAFPKTCCYLVSLTAHKRTIVSCSDDFLHYNVSQRSFMITKV